MIKQAVTRLEDLYSLSFGSIIALDTETTSLSYYDLKMEGFSLCDGVTACYVDLLSVDRQLALDWLEILLTTKDLVIMHNAPFDLQVLYKEGIKFEPHIFCTMTAQHLLDECGPTALKTLASTILKVPDEDILSWEEAERFGHSSPEYYSYAMNDAIWTYQLYQEFRVPLAVQGLSYLFYEIEMPFQYVLRDMEMFGVLVDLDELNKLNVEVTERVAALHLEILQELGIQYATQYRLDGSTEIVTGFNLNSDQQLAEALMKLGIKLRKTTPSSTKEKPRYSVDADALEDFQDHEVVNKILTYNKLNHLLTSFILPTYKHIDADGRIRPSFNNCIAVTGRLSCIAEGQEVAVPGGTKSIEAIKVGDVVYGYRGDNLTLAPVTAVMDNGIQECIRINWESFGDRHHGSLECTPDHRILTHAGWQQANALLPGDRLCHMARRKQANGRMRVYGKGLQTYEEQLIKKEWFNGRPHDHAHHKNFDRADNRLENIEIMSSEAHHSLHAKKTIEEGTLVYNHLIGCFGVSKLEEHGSWIEKSKFQLLRMLARAKGRPSKVDMDFETYKRKCEMVDIDLAKVCKRFNRRGEYMSIGRVMRACLKATTKEQQKDAGLGYYRLRELEEYYGLIVNHRVVDWYPIGKRHVYDLEVAEIHNFIVEEITAHNCSNPNLQNLTKVETTGVDFRKIFIAEKGNCFVGADYSGQELRVLAEVTRDPSIIKAFNEGLNLHLSTANDQFNLNIPVKKLKESHSEFESLKAQHKVAYNNAKIINFGIAYGKTSHGFAKDWKCSKKEAQAKVEAYFDKFPGVQSGIDKTNAEVRMQGFVETLVGRRRRLPKVDNRAYRQAFNFKIQGLSADMIRIAMVRVRDALRLAGLDARLILTVHDEIVIECKKKIAKQVGELLHTAMINAMQLCVRLETKVQYGNSYSEVK